MNKKNLIETWYRVADELTVEKPDNPVFVCQSIQFEKNRKLTAIKKPRCNQNLLFSYKKEGRFIKAKMLEAIIAVQAEDKSFHRHCS